MSTVNEQPDTERATVSIPSSVWQRRFFIVLTILGWLALAGAIIWGIGRIITPLVLIGFSALLAYLIFPLVRFFGIASLDGGLYDFTSSSPARSRLIEPSKQ